MGWGSTREDDKTDGLEDYLKSKVAKQAAAAALQKEAQGKRAGTYTSMTGQPYWVDKEGKAWTAETIKDSHLVNLLNLLKRKKVWDESRAMWLLYVAVERGLTDKLVGFEKELEGFEKGGKLMGGDPMNQAAKHIRRMFEATKKSEIEEYPLSDRIKTRTRKEAEAARQAQRREYFGRMAPKAKPPEKKMNAEDRIKELEAQLEAAEREAREQRTLAESLKAGTKRAGMAILKGGAMNRIYAVVRGGVNDGVDRMGDSVPEFLKSEKGKQAVTAVFMWGLMMSEELNAPIPKVKYVAAAGDLGMMKVGDEVVQDAFDYVYKNFGDIMFSVLGKLADEGKNLIGEDPPDFSEKVRDLEKEAVPLKEAKSL